MNGLGTAGLPSYSLGYVDLATFATLAATSIPLAQTGVQSAHDCSARSLQLVFTGVLILIGMLMLVSG
jgi:uncharacterized protein